VFVLKQGTGQPHSPTWAPAPNPSREMVARWRAEDSRTGWRCQKGGPGAALAARALAGARSCRCFPAAAGPGSSLPDGRMIHVPWNALARWEEVPARSLRVRQVIAGRDPAGAGRRRTTKGQPRRAIVFGIPPSKKQPHPGASKVSTTGEGMRGPRFWKPLPPPAEGGRCPREPAGTPAGPGRPKENRTWAEVPGPVAENSGRSRRGRPRAEVDRCAGGRGARPGVLPCPVPASPWRIGPSPCAGRAGASGDQLRPSPSWSGGRNPLARSGLTLDAGSNP